ncbi:MAG: porin, partial [Alphaproteobacteria bacterium]
GLSWGAQVELNGADTSGGASNLDDNYLWIANEAMWGRFEFGTRDGAKNRMHFGTPVNYGYDGGINGTWFNATFPAGNNGWVAYRGNNIGRATKATYFTPRFADGIIQFGASYSPDRRNGDQTLARTTAGARQGNIELGANAIIPAGDASVRLSAGYYHADQPTTAAAAEDFRTYHIGANVKFGRLEVGATWATNGESGQTKTDPFKSDAEVISAGVSYGAWGDFRVGAAASFSENAGSTTVAGDDEATIYNVGGDYHFLPGMMVFSELSFISWEDEASTATAENDATVFALGFAVNF